MAEGISTHKSFKPCIIVWSPYTKLCKDILCEWLQLHILKMGISLCILLH